MIERFTGEVPPKFLAVMPWDSKRNDQISVLIENKLEELDTWQGRLYRR
ncbi:MAG: hypothetical protein H6Q23_1943 [Bacteroidetes bacterium]|nr:hypothetical protein [Bacteroidota bacterium]